MSGSGCACSCQNASPDMAWPLSHQAPPGADQMPWSTQCVWDAMSFPQNVLQVSPPIEILSPDNAVIFSIVIVSQDSGSPQLSIRFAGAMRPEGPYETLSGPTSITTLGAQFLGAVTGITFPFVRAEMMSSRGTGIAANGCFFSDAR